MKVVSETTRARAQCVAEVDLPIVDRASVKSHSNIQDSTRHAHGVWQWSADQCRLGLLAENLPGIEQSVSLLVHVRVSAASTQFLAPSVDQECFQKKWDTSSAQLRSRVVEIAS